MRAALGDDLNRIRRQQLIVTERCGDRAPGLVAFGAGLHVVAAVATRLKAVDADDLLLPESGRERNLRVGALEFAFALRLARDEFEFLLGGGEKVGHPRDIGSAGSRLLVRRPRRIDRLGRTAINRRLGEDIVLERKRLLTGALGCPLPPLLGNEAPVRLGFGRIGGLRVLIFGERALILGDSGGGGRGGAPWLF